MPELTTVEPDEKVFQVPLAALQAVFRDGDETGWPQESYRLMRTQSTYMMRLIADIRARGIQEPILLGSDGRVWDGHHRIAAARVLRLLTVPVVFAQSTPLGGSDA